MFYVYVLFSDLRDRHYIGHTENIENRLGRHNKGLVRSTKNGRPWRLLYSEKVLTKKEAYRRELQIKSYKGGDAFKKMISR